MARGILAEVTLVKPRRTAVLRVLRAVFRNGSLKLPLVSTCSHCTPTHPHTPAQPSTPPTQSTSVMDICRNTVLASHSPQRSTPPDKTWMIAARFWSMLKSARERSAGGGGGSLARSASEGEFGGLEQQGSPDTRVMLCICWTIPEAMVLGSLGVRPGRCDSR
jgi:hypothetical protein